VITKHDVWKKAGEKDIIGHYKSFHNPKRQQMTLS
jgi:hypothetical protein